MKRCAFIGAWLVLAPAGFAQQQSELEHVPPDAPQTQVHPMPYGEMAAMMGMDDRRKFGKVMLDQLEWQDARDAAALEWDAAAWYGGDFNKLRIESKGERADGVTDTRSELLFERIVTPWWSLRAGARHDAGFGPARDWAAFGVAGIAPGFIEVEAAVYLGEGGRSALRLTTRHDLLLTQRLVLQPEVELDAYGKDDPQRRVDAGLSDLTLGLRLRYEIRREFAPYLGLVWATRGGDARDELRWIAGLRAWL